MEGEEHQSLIKKKSSEHQDLIRKKDKEIQVLDDRVKKRFQELIEAKKELVNAGKELNKSLETVKSCDRRADNAVKKYDDLKEEMRKMKESQIDEQSPVATR